MEAAVNETNVRPACVNDAPGIARLWTERGLGTQEQKTAKLQRMLTGPPGNRDRMRAWVAEQAGQIVGWCRAALFEPPAEAPGHCAPAGWYLLGVNVDRRMRRRGLATRLTQLRLEWLFGRTDCVYYFCDHDNVASIELHRTFGFTELARGIWFPGLFDPEVPLLLWAVRTPLPSR